MRRSAPLDARSPPRVAQLLGGPPRSRLALPLPFVLGTHSVSVGAAARLVDRNPCHATLAVEARRLPQLVPAPAGQAYPVLEVAAATVARAEPGLDQHDAPVHVPWLAAKALLHTASVQAFGCVRERPDECPGSRLLAVVVLWQQLQRVLAPVADVAGTARGRRGPGQVVNSRARGGIFCGRGLSLRDGVESDEFSTQGSSIQA